MTLNISRLRAHGSVRTRRIPLLGGAGLLAAGAVMVSGCSVPQVASMSKDVSAKARTAHASATASPAATATASPATGSNSTGETSPAAAAVATTVPAVPKADRGDMMAGTLTRKLNAGDRSLVVTYWTADDPGSVSASSPMTLQLAAHVEGGNVFDAIRVSRFHATFDDGSRISTVADDHGSFVLTQPFSYSTAMSLRPSVTTGTLTTLTVEWDLLVETSPASGQFYRQTVLDTLHIAFQPASAGSSS